jgi:hypothetical protein
MWLQSLIVWRGGVVRPCLTYCVREDMEDYCSDMRVARFFAESPPILRLGLCALVPPSLRRVSGSGCGLGFCRVFAESLARVVCLGSAESSRGFFAACEMVIPSPRFSGQLASRSKNQIHEQAASCNHYQPPCFHDFP